jgi:hypothetical protein
MMVVVVVFLFSVVVGNSSSWDKIKETGDD